MSNPETLPNGRSKRRGRLCQFGAGLLLLAELTCLVSVLEGCSPNATEHRAVGEEGGGPRPTSDDQAFDAAGEASGNGALSVVGAGHSGQAVLSESTTRPAAPADQGDGSDEGDPEEWIPLDRWLDKDVLTKREYYPSGALERIRTVLPGIEGPEGFHGPEMVYHANGLLKLVKTWTHGQPEGYFRTWFPTGQIKRQGAYQAGELNGDYVEYKKGGTKQYEASYVHGQLHGRAMEYYYDERPKDESHWEYGLQVGVHRVWSLDERITLEENYADGQLHGVYRSSYPDDGEPKVEGTFEQGKRSGCWRGFDVEGRLALEEYFVDGVRHGTRSAFVASVLVEKSEYENGLLHGNKNEYYEDGTERSSGRLIEGKRVGLWSYWNPDGSPIADLSGVYEDDRRIAPTPASDD